MTCDQVHDRLLTADLSALRGETDAELRAHIRTCRACAAKTDAILGDTRLLGAALRARRAPPVAPPRRRPVRVAAGLVAAVFIGAVAFRVHANGTTDSISAGTVTHTEVFGGDTGSVLATPVPTKPAPLVLPVVRPKAHQVATVSRPAAPAVDSTQPADLAPSVGVTVSGNQRATIMATSNPKITIVWLSGGSNR